MIRRIIGSVFPGKESRFQKMLQHADDRSAHGMTYEIQGMFGVPLRIEGIAGVIPSVLRMAEFPGMIISVINPSPDELIKQFAGLVMDRGDWPGGGEDARWKPVRVLSEKMLN